MSFEVNTNTNSFRINFSIPIPIPIPGKLGFSIPIPIPILAKTSIPQYQYQVLSVSDLYHLYLIGSGDECLNVKVNNG